MRSRCVWFCSLLLAGAGAIGCDKGAAPPDAVGDGAATVGSETPPEAPAPEASNDPTAPSNFQGKIAESYDESVEWWPPTYKGAPEGAPNVLLILLDDTGFAQFGSFGGLIETPNLDALAEGGLRYNNFHTTALCSPSRASIMAGRNPHSIGLGSHCLLYTSPSPRD